ncbi:DUF935 domain-containing protein [Rhodococcus sp. MSC1_016]|jgi:hypothetical protein|uniref:DUF935 domain-containing protein n=1 Tax=Rhodococcus sp. MSC1_016 TaxID=2909266 RepID=UPI00203075FF|nr:DUF935 domain-containing protein [Rhodococcus sp. MSC1_016]
MAAKATTAPISEIGYVTESTNFWTPDLETTPELMWPLSLEVFDRMARQDSQVRSILQAITLPVRRTTWRLDPNGASPEVTQLVAEDLRLPVVGGTDGQPKGRSRGRFSFPEHLRLALLYTKFGNMFFEQNYRIDEQGRARLRKLAPRMPRTISEITVARDGGLESIQQAGVDKPIPVSQLVAYVLDADPGDWRGNSVLRTAYKNWLIKDRLLRVQAQTIERNGMGVPVYEAGEKDDQPQLEAGQKIATSYKAGAASGAALPYGAKLRLLGVEGNLPDALPAINYHDDQIAKAVLAHFLNLGKQTGSWALGTTFADFFIFSLQTLADQVCDTFNQHVVEDLVDINFGEDEPAPLVVFDEIGSQYAAVADALKMLVDAGLLDPDEAVKAAVRQAYSLPAKPASPEGDTA